MLLQIVSEKHNHPLGTPGGWLCINCVALAQADDNQSSREPGASGRFQAAADRELSHGL